MRDQVADFVRRWSEKTQIGVGRFIHWLGVTTSKFYDWRERYRYFNEHSGWVLGVGGGITARVGSILPLSGARQAQRMLAGAPHESGKIVL